MRRISLSLCVGLPPYFFLEFFFHSISYDRANIILIFMPRVEDEDKENKDDGQFSSRADK